MGLLSALEHGTDLVPQRETFPSFVRGQSARGRLQRNRLYHGRLSTATLSNLAMGMGRIELLGE